MRAGRAGAFWLALALAALGGERVAAAGGCGAFPTCTGTTPICYLESTCEPCNFGLFLGLNPCADNGVCQSNGSCSATCTKSYVADAGTDAGTTGECPAAVPACSEGLCYSCTPGTRNDTFCALPTPDCNADGVCGCDSQTNCGDGGHCDTTYSPGQCTNSCQPNSGDCHDRTPYCGRLDDAGMGECVQCLVDTDCGSDMCDPDTNTCLPAPAPPTGDGGSGTGTGDAGGGATSDGGSRADSGGTGAPDATFGHPTEGALDGPYPPGDVEGGGCSLFAVGAGSSPAFPAFFGFAGLAGLFFLRRSRRRSSERRNERR